MRSIKIDLVLHRDLELQPEHNLRKYLPSRNLGRMNDLNSSSTEKELLYFPLKQFSPRFGNNFFSFKFETFTLSKTTIPFVVYKITMYLGKSTWTIERRFSQFISLSKYLKETYSALNKNAPCPPPKTCGPVTGDQHFLMQRQNLLSDYLDALLALLSKEKLLTDQKVKSFLGFTGGFEEVSGFQYCL